jgi:hypothetical protein
MTRRQSRHAKDRAWYRAGNDPAGPAGDSGSGMDVIAFIFDHDNLPPSRSQLRPTLDAHRSPSAGT